jgi:hypothetical protein
MVMDKPCGRHLLNLSSSCDVGSPNTQIARWKLPGICHQQAHFGEEGKCETKSCFQNYFICAQISVIR